jgi:S1-C subfamily serine protease
VAGRTGIRAGDIVVAANDKPVLGIRDLLDQIALHKPASRFRLRFIVARKN